MDALTLGEETMIGALAREVKDGDWAACGTLSPCPPRPCGWRSYPCPPGRGLGGREPRLALCGPVAGVLRSGPGRTAERLLPERGPDRRPGQHQPHGRGELPKPKVRLPGGAGSAILAYVVERVVLFKTTHEARGLVPQVDVITAPGYTPTLSLSQRPGRITRLVTPKCVFAFDPPQAPLLASLHPGVTLEEMRQLTGFEFRAPAPTPETPALTAEARRLLYGPVKEKLARAYPQFAARLQEV